MKFKHIFLFIIAALCASFPAAAESQPITLAFSANTLNVVANANVPIQVIASRAPESDLVFKYTYLDETHAATLPGGETALTLTLKTPEVAKQATYELSIIPGENYAPGKHANAKLVVIEGLTIVPFVDGYVFARADNPLTLNYEARNTGALNASTAFELRDEDGRALATANFSKSYPRQAFKLDIPADWTGIHTVAVWMGDRKLSSDVQIIINTGASPLYRVETNENKIAVTIDCGAGSAWNAERWLDLLDKYNAKATFFVTGYWANISRDVLDEILARGHEIGNHTWTHQRIPQMKVGALREELDSTNQVVIEETGGYTPVLFRAPYGSWDSRMVSLLNYWGYTVVQWTVDSCDSFEGIRTSTVYKNSVSDKIVPGAIVLFHNDSEHFSIMDDVFNHYANVLGLEMVRVSDLMPDDGNWYIDAEGVLRAAE